MTNLTESELARCLAVGIEAAKKAGAYSKSKWGTHLNIEYKGEINLVTEVDKTSEKMIVETLRAAFPDHDILGEEGMGERKDSPFKWVIDPLDGTTNFAHGYPL
jgi:myo-inositol-1(or 4)-monophosphatase